MSDGATWSEFGTRARRSTRILRSLPVSVRARDAAGHDGAEQTATISLNLHGCRFFSRNTAEKDAWVVLEIPGENGQPGGARLRARVAWVRRSRRLRGLYQVAVEFEAPANLWKIGDAPADWGTQAAAGWEDQAFERDLRRMLALASTGTYYDLLGVTSFSPRAQIRHSFYDLARRFHPDRNMDRPESLDSLRRLMDALTTAYKTISNEDARQNYDQSLAKSGAFELSAHKSEDHKTATECLEQARACLAAQNYAGSVHWLRQAVELDPGSSKYHALLGRSLAAIPSYRREAVEQLEKALELDPWNISAHLYLGHLEEELGLPWRARPHYERVLEIDPHDAEAAERLAFLDSAEAEEQSAETSLLDRLLGRLRK